MIFQELEKRTRDEEPERDIFKKNRHFFSGAVDEVRVQ